MILRQVSLCAVTSNHPVIHVMPTYYRYYGIRSTINECAVRILLDCILVYKLILLNLRYDTFCCAM